MVVMRIGECDFHHLDIVFALWMTTWRILPSISWYGRSTKTSHLPTDKFNPPSRGTFHLPGGSLWRVPGSEALRKPQDLVHTLRLSMSRGSRGDQSIQHPADLAVVHSGSPYPSPCRGIWGIEMALRSLSQRGTPAAVMVAAASSQEERHRLGHLLSPLGAGPLHPDWRPRDMNCGAGPRRQVTERREGRNVQSVKDS